MLCRLMVGFGAALFSAALESVYASPADCQSPAEVELRLDGTNFDTIWAAAVAAAKAEFDAVTESYETGHIHAISSRSSVSPYDTEDVEICILHSEVQPDRFVVKISQPGLPSMQLIGPDPAERIASRIHDALRKPELDQKTRDSQEFLPGPPPGRTKLHQEPIRKLR